MNDADLNRSNRITLRLNMLEKGERIDVLEFVADVTILQARVAELEAGATAEDAAAWVEQRRDGYIHDHGSFDPGTGATEFPGDGAEYVAELDDIIEGIRGLPAPTPPAQQPAGEPVALVDEADDGLFVDILYGDNGSPLKRGDRLYRGPQPPADADTNGWDADAYAKMRDEIMWWKDKAERAEADLERIRHELSPTHMGEPVVPADADRRDAERFRHLLVSGAFYMKWPGMAGNHTWTGVDQPIGHGPTIRDAIDAARQSARSDEDQ